MREHSQRDVIVIGAGVAGLTAALHLSKQDLQVTLLDGAVQPGAENWSGCAFFGENLASEEILGPDWMKETAIERPLVSRGVFMNNGTHCAGMTFKDAETFRNCATVLRPVFDHDLAEIARAQGVEILSKHTATSLIYHKQRVIGVNTEQGAFYADVVFLAEGDGAHLASKEGYVNHGIKNKGHFLQGIKEVIQLAPETINSRFHVHDEEGAAYEMLIRNARIGGKNVRLNMGAFIYTNRESLSIGLVLPLENLAENFQGEHNQLMEWFKNLPQVKYWIEGGKRVAYGAKLINANGVKDFPTIIDNGLAIGGAATGLGLDFPYPNFTGPASATGLYFGQAVREIKKSGLDFTRENLEKHYLQKVTSSQYFKDCLQLKDWAGYIHKTETFFSEFIDFKLECSQFFFNNELNISEKIKHSQRSFLVHSRRGKLMAVLKDMQNQRKALGTPPISPGSLFKALFSSKKAPKMAPNSVQLHYCDLEKSLRKDLDTRYEKGFEIIQPAIAQSFHYLYRNWGEDLDTRFSNLNTALGSKYSVKLSVHLALHSLYMAPVAFFHLISDFITFRGKAGQEKQLASPSAKQIIAARQIQEINSHQAAESCERKLGDIFYQSEENSHIKIFWPQKDLQKNSDTKEGLWHICPANVYRTEQDITGALRPIVDYENCVKCESCWRGTDMVDWGRIKSHNLHYKVPSTASATLIRHQRVASPTIIPLAPSYQFQTCEVKSFEVSECFTHFCDSLKRLQSNIISPDKVLPMAEQDWIQRLAQNSLEYYQQFEDLLDQDFYDSCQQQGLELSYLLSSLKDCLNRAVKYSENRHFFWAHAESIAVENHHIAILKQVLPIQVKKPALARTNSQERIDEAFHKDALARIKKDGLNMEDRRFLKELIHNNSVSPEQIIAKLAKANLSLAALYLTAYVARKSLGSTRNASLLFCKKLKVDGELISGSCDFALNALTETWLVVSPEGCFEIDADGPHITQKDTKCIGLRYAQTSEINLRQVKAKRLEGLSHHNIIEDYSSLFLEAVIGAGETLISKASDHALGRVQFPELFQDYQGHDGIAKFGAVKDLLSQMIARLTLLKSARGSDIPALALYTQAGKFLGTQEGSLSYNASQVFGGTGFSEDDILAEYYRDASIFKYLLGDPYALKKELVIDFSIHGDHFKVDPDITVLVRDIKPWLDEGLALDCQIPNSSQEILARAQTDILFLKHALRVLEEKSHSPQELHQHELSLEVLAKNYWQAAHTRLRDAQLSVSRQDVARLLYKGYKEQIPVDHGFSYQKFISEQDPYQSGQFLIKPQLGKNRYCPENLLLDPDLKEARDTMNKNFQDYFIKKDFDGQSYVRYAEAQHGHSPEVIENFHNDGYMRMIIPEKLDGQGLSKAYYYLLICASMQYGDPALSLIIQASTSIGTTPMLLAIKKDLPKAIKQIEELLKLRSQFDAWIKDVDELVILLDKPNPGIIKRKLEKLGKELQALCRKNSVFKTLASSFLLTLHKAGQAGLAFQLEEMQHLLRKAKVKLSKIPESLLPLQHSLIARQDGVSFYLNMISSGQTSAFALTEPSAGSDTARVATRAELKEIEVLHINHAYYFDIDGERKVLITPEQRRFENKELQIRLNHSEEWAPVQYDKYDWNTDEGYRYFMRNGEEFAFHDFGQINKKNGKLIYSFYELTGSKMWITNGRFAGLFSLYAKTPEGVTGFAVDRYAEGLIVGKDEDKMGQNASPTNEIFLEKVRVGSEFVLGLEGRGQVNALETLNVGRAGLSISAIALAQDMLDAAMEFSDLSESDLGLIGQIAEEIFIAEPSAYEMIGIFDQKNGDARMESAIGKFMNSELLHRVILYSEGIFGAASQSFAHDVEKKKRDARILNIYEGTNEIQRFLILKDLIEGVAKQDDLGGEYTGNNQELYEELNGERLRLLDQLHTVRDSFSSQAWMNAQFQSVFFKLSEITAWIKVLDGILWRLDYWGEQCPEFLNKSLRSGFKRALNEIRSRTQLFNSMFDKLQDGIFPPEVQLADLYLSELSEEDNQTQLAEHDVQEPIRVLAILKTEMIKPYGILEHNGHIQEDSAQWTPGALNVLEAMNTLPQNAHVCSVVTGPQAISPLLSSLTRKVDQIIWMNSQDFWLSASDQAEVWREQLSLGDYDLILADGIQINAEAALSYLIEGSQIPQISKCDAMQIISNKGSRQVNALSFSEVNSVSLPAAILLSDSFHGTAIKCQRYAKLESEDLKLDDASYRNLPSQKEQSGIVINSPSTAAHYLQEKLDFQEQEASVEFEITPIESIDHTRDPYVAISRSGKLSADSLKGLETLLAYAPNLQMIILGDNDESQFLAIAKQLSQTALQSVSFIHCEEALLETNLFKKEIFSKLFDEAPKKLYTCHSLSPLLANYASQQGKEFSLNVHNISPNSNGFIIDELLEKGDMLKTQHIESDDIWFSLCRDPYNHHQTAKEEEHSFEVNQLDPAISWDDRQSELQEILAKAQQCLNTESLSDAQFIIDVGYGIANQDNFDLYIKPLLEEFEEYGISASLGASRKMIESLKILPSQYQIGQSGASVAPKILLAIGISGAPQHMNYIAKHSVVIAFNKDPKAPIMLMHGENDACQVFPVTGRLQESLPSLMTALKERL